MTREQTPRVAIVHDYLTQRGGAERVVLALAAAFPGAPVYTSFYLPDATYPDFADLEVHTLPLNRIGLLRDHHRLGLPVLAPAFSRLRVTADVVICSSTGWAHGAHVTGRCVVYCHSPARWLWAKDQYLPPGSSIAKLASLALLERPLRNWDVRAARRADRYLVNSSLIRDRVKHAYGIDAEVVPPPFTLAVDGPQLEPSTGPDRAALEPGFFLCVSRLLSYKNVRQVVEAFAMLPDRQLVVVGSGPDEAEVREVAGANTFFTGTVGDTELAWLYANAAGLVAAAYEDFGITPLEAAAFGVPVAALRWGGYLDTVRDGETGVFFDRPEAGSIRDAVVRLLGRSWDRAALLAHAATFSEERFARRMREVVTEEIATATTDPAAPGANGSSRRASSRTEQVRP
jgi:glycosyltransferase involved in cell wall biosynthesis